MAKPGRSLAYADQASADIDDVIAFALDDGNWTESPTSFEVNKLPPGFTQVAQALAGVAGCKMDYTLFVRGINSDGAGDWFPLRWVVSSIASTGRTLFGLPLEWPGVAQHPAGGNATIDVVLAGHNPGPVGSMSLNDIEIDGTATKYTSRIQGEQFLLNGVGDTFLKASDPGWVVILDINA